MQGTREGEQSAESFDRRQREASQRGRLGRKEQGPNGMASTTGRKKSGPGKIMQKLSIILD